MEDIDDLKAEIKALHKAVEDAQAWGNEMRLVMLAAVLGTDRSGRNAAIERLMHEWAVERLDEYPDAENYLEISMDYTESFPGCVVLVTIQRDGGETPGQRAARLAGEAEDLRARLTAAEAELKRAREDARVLVVLTNHPALFDAAHTPGAVDALTTAATQADTLTDPEIIAVIRRAMGVDA